MAPPASAGPTNPSGSVSPMVSLSRPSHLCLSLQESKVPRRPAHVPPELRRPSSGAVKTSINPGMAMSWTRVLKSGVIIPRDAVAQLVGVRSFAVAAKGKKGGKGGAADAKPVLSKEMKSTSVFGANILKEGSDPKIQPDSKYPDWLWHLVDKRPVLSELRRKDAKTLPYEDLKHFVKLDNRARIKENNALTAKN